jgi:hypothetical protein
MTDDEVQEQIWEQRCPELLAQFRALEAEREAAEARLATLTAANERRSRFRVKANVGTYTFGSVETRFAVTHHPRPRWRFPWQKPNGGWWLGHRIFWWRG